MSSDGLTRHVQDEEILEVVQRPGDLERACAELVETAKLRGGDDNITCLLVRIVDRPWYSNIVNKLFHGGPQWQNSI
jgi:protein phosphatase